MYDIGIIGAGPSGATLARLLADRYRVLLLDSDRRKCCGGILAPEAQEMIVRFNLEPPESVVVDPQPFAVAVLDIQNRLTRYYARQYVNIDRAEFDRWLLSLVPAKVDIRHGARYLGSESTENNHLTIRFRENGREKTEQVRRLVGADGAFSTVRNEFFKSSPFPRKYLAVQNWYGADQFDFVMGELDFSRYYTGIFDSELTDFYAWTIPKNDRLIVGGAFSFGKDSRPAFRRLMEKLELYGLRLGKPCLREANQMLRPMSNRSICLGSDRVFLLGEAAGLISPSSAEGISPALISAKALSDMLLSVDSIDNVTLKRYRRNVSGLLWSLWRKQLKSPGMFTPWLRKWAILSGITAGHIDLNEKYELGG